MFYVNENVLSRIDIINLKSNKIVHVSLEVVFQFDQWRIYRGGVGGFPPLKTDIFCIIVRTK